MKKLLKKFGSLNIGATIITILFILIYIAAEPLINLYEYQQNYSSPYVKKSGTINVVDLDKVTNDCNYSTQCILSVFRTFPGGENITHEQVISFTKEEA